MSLVGLSCFFDKVLSVSSSRGGSGCSAALTTRPEDIRETRRNGLTVITDANDRHLVEKRSGLRREEWAKPVQTLP